jgi:hypothetical protein
MHYSCASRASLFTGKSSGFQVYSIAKGFLNVVKMNHPKTKPQGGNAHGRNTDPPARKYLEVQQLREHRRADCAAANLPCLPTEMRIS